MRKNLLFRLSAIAMSLILVACGGSTSEDVVENETTSIQSEESLKVVVTTPMLGEFVKQVAGENITLDILMSPAVDPHTYEPSPLDASKIADADIVFYIGIKYETSSLLKLIENTASTDTTLIGVGEEIDPIEFKDGEHDHGHDDEDGHDDDKDHDDHDEDGHDDHDEDGHEGHEGHDHGSEDPHFWFDPVRVAMAVEVIKDSLVSLDQANSSTYEANADNFISELTDLDAQVKELIESVPEESRKIVTTHESLGYLEARYGIEVFATIVPSLDSSDEISPSQIAGVIEVIEDNDIKVLFVESEAPSVYAETVAAEAGIIAVTGLNVETLKDGQTYSDFLISNVTLIVESLNSAGEG